MKEKEGSRSGAGGAIRLRADMRKILAAPTGNFWSKESHWRHFMLDRWRGSGPTASLSHWPEAAPSRA